MKLRVIAPDRGPGHVKIYLDDKEITSIVQRLDVSLAVDEVNHATLQIIPTQIEIEGDMEIFFCSLAYKKRGETVCETK